MTRPSLRTSLDPDDLRRRRLAAMLELLDNEFADQSEQWRLAYAMDCVAEMFGWRLAARTSLGDDAVTSTYHKAGTPLP